MKKINKTTPVTLGTAILVLAFAILIVAFPAQAEAQSYNYGGYRPGSYCSYPQVASIASNGYYYCTLPNQTPSYPVPQPYPYPQPYPVPVPVPQYQTLTATCYAVNTSVSAGTSVQWSVYSSGGTGTYSYNWSGTDGLSGSGQTAYMTYYSSGIKNASVIVYSGNQSLNAQCTNSVSVYGAYPQTYGYPYNYNVYQPVQQYVQPIYGGNNAGLDVGCYSDPATARVNQPVTWNVEVSGGIAPYKYSWTGSDGLSGSQSSAIKYYDSVGEKSAIVSVTSADGKTGTRACSNAVNISRAYVAPTAPVQPVRPPVQPPAEPDNSLSAASLFSLSNIPWGWVALLVILVLFGTVMYLLFNRPKI